MNNDTITHKKTKIAILIASVVLFIISMGGITYAYFATGIIGNEEASSMRTRSAKKTLTYNDIQFISDSNTLPGWTQTKTLIVTNTGRSAAAYNIKWNTVTNNITNNELVVSATCVTNLRHTCSNIPETSVPYSDTSLQDSVISWAIDIAPGETHTYTFTITFKNMDYNQDYNQRKAFKGLINIEESKLIRAGIDADTGLPVVKYGSEEFLDLTNAIDYTFIDSTFLTKINYNASKSILLAKYNLYVGQNCTSSSSCTPISTSDSRYGLQSVDAKGYRGNWDNPAVGVVPFAGTGNSYAYWYDSTNSTIYTKYGTTYYANNIYDTNYVTVPNYSVAFYNNAGNANYSIAYYVEEYVNRLGINGTGRLLTYPEASGLQTIQRGNGAYYWLGTAKDDDNVWATGSGGYDDYAFPENTNVRGVRPVIVVNTSDIQSSQ